ncbi:MAG: ABC transporter ATP-binding protein [Clostridia bacterium]|nr:ABC transporter ATP-binding protein [Clostridia bacterium]
MKNNKKTSEEKVNTLGNNLFMIGFIAKNAPGLMFFYIFFDVLSSVPGMLANVVLLKYIIDTVTSGENLHRILIACLIFTSLIIIGGIGSTVFYEILLPKQREKLHYKLYSMIYEKAAKMDYEAYDNPKYYNDLVLAMNSMSERVDTVMSNAQDIVRLLVSIVSISAVIASIDPLCLVFIFLCVGFMIPMGRVIAKTNVKRQEAMTPLDRKNLYFSRVFYLQDYAKELRLSPAGKMIERRYDKNVRDRLFTITPFLRRQWQLYFCQESLPMTLIVYLGIALYMGYKAIVTKEVSLGDFVATFNGANSVSVYVFQLTSWFALGLHENALYIEKFRKFMSAEEKIVGGDLKKVYDSPVPIKLENVSFTYPGNDKPTLKNISLEIKPYQKIALVGYNGAGKTTLTNLLLRLYDVTEGRITVDGTDIRDWDIPSYHQNFAAVFQDFSLFGASVGENVSMSNNPDSKKVLDALKESNFKKKLSKGTDTILLREFDESGLSLSGGEAQKVAVARAFYKECPFAILDEPSANLDPVSEYALNESMTRAADDKTVIFISHRLSTTVMADVIYMLEKGEIVESGTHEELMAMNGKYAYMFNLQAEKYRDHQNDHE